MRTKRFKHKEVELLQKGKKFAVPPPPQKKKPDHLETTILADLSSGIRGDSSLNTQHTHSLIQDMCHALHNPTDIPAPVPQN